VLLRDIFPAPGNQTDGEQKKSKADEPFTSKYSLAACQCRNANILVCCLLILLSANQQEIFFQPSLTRIEFANFED
jgi:hypothetical protein